MIQVPPGSEAGMTPWLAGGGSTVRSVPEQGSIKPFVNNYGGKQGAYVIMADGSVRFVKGDVSDKVFQDMVTVGPKAPDFDEQVNKYSEVQGAPNAPPPPKPAPPETKPPQGNPNPPVAPPQPNPGATGWQKYSSPEYGFSVMFPGQPKTQTAEIPTPQGKLNATIVGLETDQGKTAYGVMALPIPPGSSGNVQQGIDMGMQMAQQMQPGTKVKSQKDIALGGYKGREASFEVPGKGELVLRIYAVDQRVLLLIAGSENMASIAQNAQTFFDSFTVEKK